MKHAIPHPCAPVCRVATLPHTTASPAHRQDMARKRPICFFWTGCHYDIATKDLLVHFTVYRKDQEEPKPNGRPYQYVYHNVPLAVAASFINDDANGEYYNYVIRDHFSWRRVN